MMTHGQRERMNVQLDGLMDEALRVGDPVSPDSATWGLHARVDRAVTDYVAQLVGRDTQASEALTDTPQLDGYTYLIVKATLVRRQRLPVVTAMSYARPFCPPFEAIEDAIIKPLAEIAHSEDSPDARMGQVLMLLSDWIPEITQDVGAWMRDHESDDE